jgi:dTDP-4-dehydrorhamnose 3,5-epimerase
VKFVPTELPEVVRVEPDLHGDARGLFLETWHERKYREGGIPGPFVQDNFSHSLRGALRGLHAQLDPAQGKLVRAVRGEIFDVAVDLRVGSPRFGHFAAVRLDGERHHQLWIPPGFAHGFCVLSEEADVEYKCTAPYRPEGEIAVAWNDPRIGVPWPVDDPVLSARDAAAPPLAEVEARLPRYAP